MTPNRAVNRRAWNGDSGAVIERTYRSGVRSVTDASSLSIAMAAGGSTVERMPCRATSAAKSVVENRSITTIGAPARRPNSTL